MGVMNWVVTVVPTAVAAIAAYVAFRKAPSETRKIDADADLTTVEAANIVIQNLTGEVQRLEAKLDEEREFFQKEIASLRAENERQSRHLHRLETKLKETISQ